MRDEEAQRPQTAPSSSTNFSIKRGGSGFEGLSGRGKYKLWALTVIVLLALWSMFTGTVTLKWSAVNLKHASDDLDSFIHGDLDILDVDEREKMVRRMWNVYKHNRNIRMPSFWQDAFGAAYQDLTDEVASVRNAALLEIAKMSFWSGKIDDPPQVESAARVSKEKVRSRMKVARTRKPQ